MVDGGEDLGRLSTETVAERRERLVVPRETGSKAWRRVNVALLVVLALGVGVFFGVVPGSAAVGRYPVWDLYALAERIEAAPTPVSSDCGPARRADARVDLLTGRVVVVAEHLDLADEELAMVTWAGHDPWSAPAVGVTRVAAGAPTICVT